MADKQKVKTKWKIPWLDVYIVRGNWLIRRDKRFVILERYYKRLLDSNRIRSRQIGNMQHRINVMNGRIPAPLCPKCDKPKIAGGIQWIDHAECCKPKNKIPENESWESE